VPNYAQFVRNLSINRLEVTKHRERILLHHSPEKIYSVVKDVEQYKEFIPWCTDSRIMNQNVDQNSSDGEQNMLCELEVGFGMFKEKYRSEVTLDPYKAIYVRSTDEGILDHLVTQWKFVPTSTSPDKCWVTFMVEFRFRSQLHEAAAKMVLSELVAKMASAFTKRCDVVHGDGR
jgi:coenzyme Q-binding protein COQ10